MKKIILLIFSLVLFSCLIAFPAMANESGNITIYMDGVKADIEAKLIDSTTFVPVVAFVKETDSGVAASWDGTIRKMTLISDNMNLSIGLSDAYMTANERCFYLASSIIIEDHVYVPIRDLSGLYGLSVEWNGAEQSIYLTKTNERIAPASAVYNTDDLYWLSRIISAESKGEPFLGQIAVGNVVLNRLSNAEYPKTVKDVIFDCKFGVQFTPVANQTIYNEPTESSIAAAKVCLEGTSLTKSALYFLNPEKSTSGWIEANRTYIMTIGSHCFYT